MAKLWHLALAGALAIGGQAQAQAAKDTRPMDAQRPGAMGTDTQKSGVTLPSDEKAFFEWLHHSNQTEVQLGQLAQDRGVSSDVKQFGQMMVTQHRDADQKLMAYAKQKNWSLGDWKPQTDADKKVEEADKAGMDKLKALNGEMFDRSYVSMMVGDHDADIAKVSAAANRYQDSAPFLKALVPTLTQHRDHAYRLLGQMKPQT